MRSTIVIFVLTFALLGLFLGYAASYDTPAIEVQVLELRTDKPEYDRGEPVIFTARNVGSEQLVFPDSALGISIRNVNTGKGYSVIALQVLTPIEPGQAKEVVWSQEGNVGETADVGTYVASIRTAADSAGAKAEVSFRIR